VVRLSIIPPEGTVFTDPATQSVTAPQLALSPDGRAIVFAAAPPGTKATLWLRSLDASAARELTGTTGAEGPFWSPDSRSIGFVAGGKLKVMPSAGGPPQVLAEVRDWRGADWGRDGQIIFGGIDTGIKRISTSGGTATAVKQVDAALQEGSHRFPQLLPDGDHFLYTIRSTLPDRSGVFLGSLRGGMKKQLVRGFTAGFFAPPQYLLFFDGNTLMGQRFDLKRLELVGQPFQVEAAVARTSTGNGAVSASATGTLSYVPTGPTNTHLVWFDRGGQRIGPVGSPGDYTDFRLSPDQTKLAVSIARTGFPDIWLVDLAGGSAPAPFTFGPSVNAAPVWSRDGFRIIFRTTRSGGLTEFYSKSAGGGGQEQNVSAGRTLTVSTVAAFLTDWSPDGRHLLFSVIASLDHDLWLMPLQPGAPAVSFLAVQGDQLHGNFSPDGTLVAYSSDESERFEVHVQTFPLSERQWTVSTAGGYEPRWRADGQELYYLSLDRVLMAVPVSKGPIFGTPRALFQTRVAAGVSPARSHYVPSRNGQRFLVNTQSSDPAPTPITVVLNWTADLKR
jgi:Tol biopolymer transport system component